MTPQERQLVDDLFDRLATLESAPRDPDAVRAINARPAHARRTRSIALVQTVLVQDEALKRADARIQRARTSSATEQPQQQPGGFLDIMRDTLFGQARAARLGADRAAARAAGPPDLEQRRRRCSRRRPGNTVRRLRPALWRRRSAAGRRRRLVSRHRGGGGRRRGRRRAADDSFRGMMGGGDSQGQSFGDSAAAERRHRAARGAAGDQSGSDLAREAGLNDIGCGRTHGRL